MNAAGGSGNICYLPLEDVLQPIFKDFRLLFPSLSEVQMHSRSLGGFFLFI